MASGVMEQIVNVSSGIRNSSEGFAHDVVVEGVGARIDMTWVGTGAAIDACALAVMIACLICAADMWQHLGSFDHPRLQSGTLRILFMIPVYGVLSFITLILPQSRFLLRTLRDTYEAFVLYQFLALLVEYCGGEAMLVQCLERKRYKGIHPFPMCFLPMFNLDRSFFIRCKRWVLQYAIIKPLMALVALVTHPFGIYDELNLDWGSNVFPWVFLVNNFALTWSLWYLVVFHQETERELHYCRPLLKFICIKSIIFFSYWQTSALSVMLSIGMIYTGDTPEERELVGGSIQEFLICLELVPIAVLHHFGFGALKLQQEMKEKPLYESATAVRRGESRFERLDEALSLGQFFRDTYDAVFVKKNQLRHGGGTKAEAEAEAEAVRAVGGGAGGHQPSSKQNHPLFSRVAWPEEADLKLPADEMGRRGGAVAVPMLPVSETTTAVRRGDAPPIEEGDEEGHANPHDARDPEVGDVEMSVRREGAGARSVGTRGASPSSYPPPLGPPPQPGRMGLPPGSAVRRRAPIGIGADGRPASSTETALQLCTAVAAAQGARPTTAEVMRAAVAVELRRQGAVVLSSQGSAAAASAVAAVAAGGAAPDLYDWSSDDSGGSSDDDDASGEVNEAEANERASRDAWRFGLRTDDFRIITNTVGKFNQVAQRVLFDEDAATTTRFCVVCGRSDRELIQRKSGLKCRECLGRKHNYQAGDAV